MTSTADIISQWRVVAQNVENVETKLINVNNDLVAKKVQKQMLQRTLQDGGKNSTVEDSLRQSIAAHKKETAEIQAQSASLEAWCRQRAAKKQRSLGDTEGKSSSSPAKGGGG
eukprot:PhF_6_TR39719/c1_g1_i1/m.59120